MYESFYGCREKPFSILPDPEFLYLSPSHRSTLSILDYGLRNQASFTVVTGEIGSGKTTLIRKLLQDIDDNVRVGLVTNTRYYSFKELLQWILFAFELEYHGDEIEIYNRFIDFLIKEYAVNRRVIIIIDEAQNLGPEALEQLRMLSNVNADKNQLLQMVLIGQPNLRELLSHPRLEQFAQRISIDYHLDNLNSEETKKYIKHRINHVGGDPNTFTEQACSAIWHYSNGVPRLINVLCDLALVYGFAEQQKYIDIQLIHEVADSKNIGLASREESEKLVKDVQAFKNAKEDIDTINFPLSNGHTKKDENVDQYKDVNKKGKSSSVPIKEHAEHRQYKEVSNLEKQTIIERWHDKLIEK